ncbi:MAG TPA: diguanylate cyclase [Candidatus Limiplasma sp.]|nr:diguanylate cyclase [Candidatus Limiplasma sp.]HPS81484.1 diguanylate cyclase [Candidatus Limiplasma sp.]
MPLLTNILLITSLFLLIALSMRTGKSLRITGMPTLFSTIIFFSVWVGGNLVELNASNFPGMLLGRNIQQIGVFLTPLCTLYFSIDYTANRKLRIMAYLLTVIQVVSIILIFTDSYHHLMRSSVIMQTDPILGHVIVVQSTKVGLALVAVNFCIPLISMTNLIAFTRKVSAQFRRPLWLIIISIFATFVLAFLQSAVLCNLGIHIPIPVWNLPCLVLFSYAVLNEGFVGIAPTALSKVFEVIDQGIVVVNERGIVLELNRRACELMENLRLPGSLKPGTQIAEYLATGNAESQNPFQVEMLPTEIKNTKRNQYLALAYHALESHKGKRIGYVLVITDITLLKVRAEIDSLTGSYNREGMVNAYADLQKDAVRTPYLSALIVDMDDFKTVNDTYGHLGGDVVLCDFVGFVQSLLPEKCFLGRLGGDEFVVILPTEMKTAAEFAEMLRERVSQRTVAYRNDTIRYTASVGIASCKNEECSLSELLHKADLALYEAKREGKNAVHMD